MYHISLERLKEDDLLFIPRIPKTAGTRENKTIPRVCLSKTIEGCIEAILTSHIHKGLYDCKYFNKEELYMYVYTPMEEIQSDYIIDDKTIKENEYVHDVEKTKEIWILKPTKMKLYSVLEITNVKESYDWVQYADFGLDEFPYKIQYKKVI